MPAEAVCLASGPSLTSEDVARVRAWRSAGDRLVVVTNTTFRAAPWADVLYVMDSRWWDAKEPGSPWANFAAESKATFAGERIAATLAHRRHGLDYAPTRWPGWQPFGNSGAGAINVAWFKGARRIVLLGYDCQRSGNRSHWHGDHPKGLANAATILDWPDQFRRLAKALNGKAEIVNASRDTALKAWPRCALEEALGPAAA